MKNWKSTDLIYKYFQLRLLRSKRDRRTQTSASGKCSVKGGRGVGWLNEAALLLGALTGMMILTPENQFFSNISQDYFVKITHLNSNDIFLQILNSHFSTPYYSWNQMFFKFHYI